MSGAATAALAIVLALAVIPLTIGYAFWLANHLVPRLARLPMPLARTFTALFLVLPWVLGAVVVWWVMR
jgi:hypothetical protein